jgi:murein DD-endopeptidase MepM/ murein hydrolase activator NlpD
MVSPRTTLVLLVSALVAGVIAAPAVMAKKPQPIVFPLIGEVEVDDNYGDPRANGAHAGIDMTTPRRTPVVAAEAGSIKWWTTSSRAGCMLYLHGASGTTYLYIHLNNDRTLGNDNTGGCLRGSTYLTRDGAKVTAGELIAWSGDSGDANGNPHLHFEVHPNDGADVNPYPFLLAAERLLFPGRLGTRFTIGLRGSPVSAGAGRISLAAASVRWWPGGKWTPIGSRIVRLRVTGTTQVDESLAASVAATSERAVAGALDASTITIFTSPAKVTADAIRGMPEALAAARITRPGGTLVPIDPVDEVEDETDPAEDPLVPPRPY